MARHADITWRVFDRETDVKVSHRQLPHWDQTGALTFVTIRLADSLPAPTLRRWRAEQADWLARHELAPTELDRALRKGTLPEPSRRRLLKFRRRRWHNHLDRGHGRCWLRDAANAEMVRDALLYFDGDRYDVERLVVMPNHVHLLVQMRPGYDLRKQCASWMRYTARRINAATGASGEFWQSEAFDHVVRSDRQFEYLREYIYRNPVKANLREGGFLFWQRRSTVGRLSESSPQRTRLGESSNS